MESLCGLQDQSADDLKPLTTQTRRILPQTYDIL